jgi:hypothetical protein
MERPWRTQLEAAKGRGDAILAGLDEARMHSIPAPDGWSIGLCLEHLTIAAEKIAEKLEAALDARGGKSDAATAWRPGLIERKFIAMCGPNAGGKTPVPKIFEPTGTWDVATTQARLLAAHERLLALDARASDADLMRVRAASAALPLFRMRLAAWLAACAVHADYHLSQAEALRIRN